MTTQLESARKGTVSSEMKAVAAQEGLDATLILDHVAKVKIVIPCNPNRKHQKIVGIGKDLCTKVNASIGTSSDICEIGLEVEKARAPEEKQTCNMCLDFGAIKKGMEIFETDIREKR